MRRKEQSGSQPETAKCSATRVMLQGWKRDIELPAHILQLRFQHANPSLNPVGHVKSLFNSYHASLALVLGMERHLGFAPQSAAASSRQQTSAGINTSEPSLIVSSHGFSVDEAAATPLPPSSPALQSPGLRNVHPPRSPNILRRSSSSMSIDRRSSSPSLQRRTSTTSLRNHDGPPTPPKLSRRTPSQQYTPSPLAPQMEETPSVTASSIAEEYFKQDLTRHDRTPPSTNTVVVLHDSCYGHRYSRPGSLKSVQGTLSVIVERPERIQASVLGISTAYVRLGERHAGGRNAPNGKDVPADLPFTIRKTSRNIPIDSPFVTAIHGTAWMKELKEMCGRVEQKLPSGKELDRVSASRTEPAKEKLHEGDLYLSVESLQAFEGALGGVFDGVDIAFQDSQSLNGPHQSFVCIRPPGHHCAANHPSGFCWLNNVHVGINYAAQTYGLTHAAIIDFDLHHGDGSQSIAWAHNENMAQPTKSKKTPSAQKYSIGYFSLHDINSYPCEYGDREKVQNASLCVENAHGQSIWNVHLQKWTTEAEFWKLYETKYTSLLEKARSFLRSQTRKLQQDPNGPRPKAAIFLSAGFDASEHEHKMMQRHDVCVPTEFYARFTRDTIALAREEGLAVDGRIISVLEGGYSDKALISGVLSHISGLCDGDLTKVKKEEEGESRLGMEMTKGMMGLAIKDEPAEDVNLRHVTYDPEWWHPENLNALEELLNPTPTGAPKQLGKKPRAGAYSSPTASSTAKIVDPSKIHRSVSASHRLSVSPSRAATPPLPEVDWITATHELCKLLVPKDRTTRSFTGTELSESVTKKDRRTTLAAPAPAAPTERQLRSDRGKSKASSQANGSAVEPKPAAPRTVSAADRRRTIADLPLSSDGAADERPVQMRRRSSTASTISAVSAAASVATAARSSRPAAKPPNGVQVKKTRSTSAAPAGQSGTKPPPVPRIPSSYSNSSKATAQGTSQTKSAPETREGSVETDLLTSGFQKLKINVPSNEEYATRQQKKAGEEVAKKATSSKASSKLAASRVPKTTTAAKKIVPKDTKGKASTSGKATSIDSSVAVPATGPASADVQMADVTAGAEQPLQLPNSPAVVDSLQQPPIVANGPQSSISPAYMHTFEQYPMQPQIQPVYQPNVLGPAGVMGDGGQPFHQPQSLVFQQEYAMNEQTLANGQQQAGQQLQWQTPNKDLVSPPLGPKKTRSPPKFTATGHIPFAGVPQMATQQAIPQSNEMEPQIKTEENGVNIWEVPETPLK